MVSMHVFSKTYTYIPYIFNAYQTFELHLPELFYCEGVRGGKVRERNGCMMDKQKL